MGEHRFTGHEGEQSIGRFRFAPRCRQCDTNANGWRHVGVYAEPNLNLTNY